MSFGLFEAGPDPVAAVSILDRGITLSLPLKRFCGLCSDPDGWMPVTETGIGRCFFQGFVLNVPTILSLIFGTMQVLQLRSKRNSLTHTSVGWRIPVQLSLIVVQALLWLRYALRSDISYQWDVGFISPFLAILALIPVAFLTFVERFRGDKPSGSLLLYWAVSTIVLIGGAAQETSNKVGLFLAINSAVCLALEETAPRFEDPFDDRRRNPYDRANVFSRLTFSWLTPLMKQGYDHFLSADDLPNLASADRTDLCLDAFQGSWSRELTRHPEQPSLVRALMGAFGTRYALGGVCKLVQDVLAFVQPQLLRLLINFVNEYLADPEYVPLTKGLYIAAGMFLVALIQTTALHQYFERSFGTGMRVRAALTNAIFRKSLIISSEARGKRSIGDTVNLMSIDTQRIQDVCPNGHNLWSSPLQITLCLASLYQLVGNSMWSGVFVLALLIPVNSWLASVQKELQRGQMKYKDLRTRLTSELLSSIKSIKLYAWEDPFVARLKHARNVLELGSLRSIGVFMSSMSFVWAFTPFIVSCSTFACYTLLAHKPLTTDKVFPALALFNLLQFPMAMFPMLISSLVEAGVAAKRIRDFMLTEERQKDAVSRLPAATEPGQVAVDLEDATFVWQREPERVALQDTSLKVRKGELFCIVGRVGCGKSALLQALLGDIRKTKGNVIVRGHTAYVAQQPWILNATVRENILFGCKYDEAIYEETIRACALRDDLAVLPDGDSTLVGERGISLSGGQKARISLARAVYARADVYLLDDPLSAVDEHVGRHIIDNVLSKQGLLGSKAVILATNSIPVLRSADHIAMVAGGAIIESGATSEVAQMPRISALLAEFGRHGLNESVEGSATASPEASSEVPQSSQASGSPETEVEVEEGEDDELPETWRPTQSQAQSSASLRRPSVASLRPSAPVELRKEHMEQGKVSWGVYTAYARVSGMSSVLIFLGVLVLSSGLSLGSNVWLKHWSETPKGGIGYYLTIYAILGIAAALLSVVQNLVLYLTIGIRSARILHDKMLAAVIRAPMSFFETTPLGRIINRFSNDVYRVDNQLARVFMMLFNNTVRVLFTIGLICWGTPIFIALVLPLAAFYLYYQRYYLRTSRELKRLDSVSKSPVYAQFQEVLDGVSTVRAFGATERFEFLNQCYIDSNNKAYFPSISANRWLAVRLEFIGSVIILSAAALSVLSLPTGRLSAGLIGLSLSYALQTTQSLNWIVRMSVEVETNIVSVERMLEYAELPSEAPLIVESSRPPQTWPNHGAVILNDYSTRYRPELPMVLKHISLNIKPGEKIGIVGRTGAGKSSLSLALFRLIEAAEGNISIDGINTSQIGLHDLRSHLSIIPQDSQLFEGTIRDNLDPAHLHTDDELWHSLELSHLKDHVTIMDGGLDAAVSEGGSNMSAGQRQLLCLARAVLTTTKVLVLDEATAAVDVETDQMLQQIIRKEFADRTILTIAHRINTILDSDRVVVLNYGEVAEFGSPAELLHDESSMFYALCKRGGLITEPSSESSATPGNNDSTNN